jgi:hypothetical protein
MGKKKPVRPAGSKAEFEYVTSAVSLLDHDGIVVHVVNDSPVLRTARVVIYRNTGAGAVTATDSGMINITPTWNWGLGYTVSTSGEYWLRIQTSSQFLIPKASFERLEKSVWIPVVTYRPGDFAIVKIKPTRKRLW